MKPNILTHRYAKAFLDLAMQTDVVDKCHDDLRLVKNTFENNEELRTLIHQPFLSKERKKIILTRIFKDRTESITIDLLCLQIAFQPLTEMLHRLGRHTTAGAGGHKDGGNDLTAPCPDGIHTATDGAAPCHTAGKYCFSLKGTTAAETVCIGDDGIKGIGFLMEFTD